MIKNNKGKNVKSFIQTLSHNLHQVQRTFFPDLEEEAGPIPKSLVALTHVLETVHAEKIFFQPECWRGRPQKSRRNILNAFIAKAYLRIDSTKYLKERLHSDRHLRLICGFENRNQIPSESLFSRAFAEFSWAELPTKIHKALIKVAYSKKIILHKSTDSTAIHAREKPQKKKTSEAKSKRRRGRQKKGEQLPPKKLPRLKRQHTMSLEEMIKDLPSVCDRGCKRNSQGYTESWNGYKLHLDVSDDSIPISAILTLASVHDSQVAIPLAKISADRVKNFYDLMDAAYDMKEIREHSLSLNHIPLIDINPRANKKLQEELKVENKARKTINWKPAEAIRYNKRTSVERANARLKDEFGGRNLRVRGASKAFCHLMFGVLVLTADQLLRLVK